MHWGGALGGPVFKEVMSFVLQSRHISPTNTEIKPVALNEAVLKKNTKFVSKASGR
jgi:cell division protein FtsI (penicillin-binding protein 3)